jgi:hypothetical protein
VITPLEDCGDMKGMLAVLAALIADPAEIKDKLDRLVVARFEGEEAWKQALLGLEDHGKNIGTYDKAVRPGRDTPPSSLASGCPKFSGSTNKRQDVDKHNLKVSKYNQANGTSCPTL